MSGRRRRPKLPVALFRWAFRLAPREHREAVADEAADAFEAGYARRLEHEGSRAARRYLRHAVADAALAGWRLRRERRGEAAREPRRAGSRPLTTGLRVDLRQALRRLRRAPGHAAALVAILALGVGANTAVLSALRTAVAAPPPYQAAERLVFPRLTVLRGGEEGMSLWSWHDFVDFREATGEVFSNLAGYAARSASWNDPGEAESVPYELVTPGYFEALGATPAAGRFFSSEEGGAAAPGVVVLSHATWHRRFGGDPEAVGRAVTVDGVRLRVIGVAGADFRGLTGDPAFWVPIGHAHAVYGDWMFENRDSYWFHAVARLAPGTPVEAAQALSDPVGRRIMTAERLEQGQRVEVSVVPFGEVWTNPTTRASIGLVGAGAGLLLLIAIANVASLLLVRNRREARETAVRLALGAGRARLLRARLIESLVIAALAGVAGLVLAAASVDAIRALWPERLLTGAGGEVRWIDPSDVTLDLPVMLAGLGLATLAALVFTLLPALFQRGAVLVPALKLGAGALGAGGGRSGGHGARGRSLLLGGQVAFSVALLVAAGLLSATLLRLHAEQRGFEARGLLTVGYTFAGRPLAATAAAKDAAHEELRRRAGALPGVRSASLGTTPPLAGHSMRTRVSETIGGTHYREDRRPPIGIHAADHGLFRTLGVRLLEGRVFTEAEDRQAGQLLVLSRLAARRLFPGESAVGRQIRIGFSVADWDPAEVPPPWTVIGVVDDVLYATPAEGLIAEAYVPYGAWKGQSFATLFVRAAAGTDPADLVPALRREMDAIDAGVPFWRTRTGEELRAEGVADTRVLVLVLSWFAALALLLSATGVWAVVAQAVAERRREIGLRVALGARAREIEGLLVRQGVAPLVFGGACGLALAALGSRALAGLLFHTPVHDPAAFAGAAAVLAAVWLLASWLPARAARRVDPVEALSSD